MLTGKEVLTVTSATEHLDHSAQSSKPTGRGKLSGKELWTNVYPDSFESEEDISEGFFDDLFELTRKNMGP